MSLLSSPQPAQINDSLNYRGLWSAVILQAFFDLKLRNEPMHLKNKKALAKVRAGALEFIYSERDAPRTFQWICDSLDLDANWLREMALTEEGIDRVISGRLRGDKHARR